MKNLGDRDSRNGRPASGVVTFYNIFRVLTADTTFLLGETTKLWPADLPDTR